MVDLLIIVLCCSYVYQLYDAYESRKKNKWWNNRKATIGLDVALQNLEITKSRSLY